MYDEDNCFDQVGFTHCHHIIPKKPLKSPEVNAVYKIPLHLIFNDHTAAILIVLRRPGQTSLKRTAWKSGNGYRIHMKITCKAFHTMMQGTDRKLAQRRLSLSTCTGRTPFRASRVLMKKICWTDEPPTRHVTNFD